MYTKAPIFERNIQCEVPQRSVLRPLYFLTFVNDFPFVGVLLTTFNKLCVWYQSVSFA